MTELEKLDNSWNIALPFTTAAFIDYEKAFYEKELVQKFLGYALTFTLKMLGLMQVILSLRHFQLSMRFTTNISFDIFMHHFVFSICEFLKLNPMMYVLLDYILLVVIAMYALDFVLDLINETRKKYNGIFGNNIEP